jgi:hypothetical protein
MSSKRKNRNHHGISKDAAASARKKALKKAAHALRSKGVDNITRHQRKALGRAGDLSRL